MRCAFCGHRDLPAVPELAGGRPVCSSRCAERESARQAATPAQAVIDVVEVDGVRRVDQVAWACGGREADLRARVLAKLGGGPLAITTDLRAWTATWRRRCPCHGDSDERCEAGASLEEVLARILAWEESGDAEYADCVSGVHGDTASETPELTGAA